MLGSLTWYGLIVTLTAELSSCHDDGGRPSQKDTTPHDNILLSKTHAHLPCAATATSISESQTQPTQV